MKADNPWIVAARAPEFVEKDETRTEKAHQAKEAKDCSVSSELFNPSGPRYIPGTA